MKVCTPQDSSFYTSAPASSRLRDTIKFAGVLLIVLLFGLAVVDHYGISSDEMVEIEMVQWNVDLVTEGAPIPSNLKHYGPVFNFAAEMVYRLFYGSGDDFLPRVQVKHVLTFLASFGAYLSAAGIVSVLAGRQWMWLAVILLASFPRFWGHSFFNPKDIPFAAAFTVATYGSIRLLRAFLRTGRPQTGWNRLTLASILFGALLGMVTGTRIAGFLFLLFVPGVHLIIKRQNALMEAKKFAAQYALVFVGWAIVTIAVHPASWSNPLWWFVGTVSYLSSHDAGISMLFAGQTISSGDPPWYYLPVWFVLTTPLLHLMLLATGLFWIALNFRSLDVERRAAVLLVLLQFTFLPAVAIVKGSSVYDEMRQFLFVIPAAAVVCTLGFSGIYQFVRKSNLRPALYIILAIGLIPVVLDMRVLHPYEYAYFNRISGGLEDAYGKYETDYWGLSMREGMEWINRNAPENARVISSRFVHSARPFARNGATVIAYEEAGETNISRPFYYIARPRWNYQQLFPECRIVYSVTRQNVPLTVVKLCE